MPLRVSLVPPDFEITMVSVSSRCPSSRASTRSNPSGSVLSQKHTFMRSIVAKKSVPNFIRLTSTDSPIDGWTLRYSLYRSHSPRVMRGRVARIERVEEGVGTKRLLQEKFSTSGQRLCAQRRCRVRGQDDD